MFRRGAPIPDVYHAWINSLFGAGVAWVIFGVGVILYAYTTATATAPPSGLAIFWGGVFVAVGLCCWIAMYPVWHMGRKSAEATAAQSGMDALEEWKRDLTRPPQRIELVNTRPTALMQAAEHVTSVLLEIHNQERLAEARKLESSLMRGEDLSNAARWPYPTGLKEACEDWFERTMALLPPTKRPALRQIGIYKVEPGMVVPRSFLNLNPALVHLASVIDDMRKG